MAETEEDTEFDPKLIPELQNDELLTITFRNGHFFQTGGALEEDLLATVIMVDGSFTYGT